MTRRRAVSSILIVTLVLIAIQGCVLVPFISSFKEMGVTKEDRVKLLEKDLKNFHYAMAEGRNSKLLSFVQETYQRDFRDQMRQLSRDEKIVDSTMSFMDLSEDGYHADVEMLVRYFRKPVMIVNERIEKQRWYFSLNDGWRLGERVVLDGSPA